MPVEVKQMKTDAAAPAPVVEPAQGRSFGGGVGGGGELEVPARRPVDLAVVDAILPITTTTSCSAHHGRTPGPRASDGSQDSHQSCGRC